MLQTTFSVILLTGLIQTLILTSRDLLLISSRPSKEGFNSLMMVMVLGMPSVVCGVGRGTSTKQLLYLFS